MERSSFMSDCLRFFFGWSFYPDPVCMITTAVGAFDLAPSLAPLWLQPLCCLFFWFHQLVGDRHSKSSILSSIRDRCARWHLRDYGDYLLAFSIYVYSLWSLHFLQAFHEVFMGHDYLYSLFFSGSSSIQDQALPGMEPVEIVTPSGSHFLQ